MRISDWSSDVCSSDLGAVYIDDIHDQDPDQDQDPDPHQDLDPDLDQDQDIDLDLDQDIDQDIDQDPDLDLGLKQLCFLIRIISAPLLGRAHTRTSRSTLTPSRGKRKSKRLHSSH